MLAQWLQIDRDCLFEEWHMKPRCPKHLGQITQTTGAHEKRMSGGDPLWTIPSCSHMREASPMQMSNRKIPCSIGGRAPTARSGTTSIHPTDSGMAKPTMGRPHCCCYWAVALHAPMMGYFKRRCGDVTHHVTPMTLGFCHKLFSHMLVQTSA